MQPFGQHFHGHFGTMGLDGEDGFQQLLNVSDGLCVGEQLTGWTHLNT